jgi:hypothetical protein
MDEDRMQSELAAQPLDDTDAAMLREVRALFETTDPVPADLAERVHFALALDAMFDEVARMTRVPLDAMAARGDAAATRTETITFSAERLTAMVTVNRLGAGRLRMDGWLAPPEPLRVSLRMKGRDDRDVGADDQGRFSFDDLEEGFAQLRIFPADHPDDAVVTPLFQL